MTKLKLPCRIFLLVINFKIGTANVNVGVMVKVMMLIVVPTN